MALALSADATELTSSDKIQNLDLTPSDSSRHYSYGSVYGHQDGPYGKARGFEHNYGREVGQGYNGYDLKEYSDHQTFGENNKKR